MDGVCDDEYVWRDVYYNQQAKYFKKPHCPVNSVAKAFFGERKYPISEISVNLYDRVSLGDATAFADVRGSKMKNPKTVKGWWTMLVADLRECGCSVKHTPVVDNEYHADIMIPDGHCDTWEDAEVYLRSFLSNRVWQDRDA